MTARPSRLVLLGYPVRQSLSPQFQNAALRHAGSHLKYEAVEVKPESLDEKLDELVALSAAGNVTVPHKAAVAARCGRLTPLAERLQAVNTFWVEDGTLVGDNTDVDGFDALARATLGGVPRGARVAILGAGGGAAAVLGAVEKWPGAQATVWNRHPERAVALAERFAGVARATAAVPDALRGATIVVNATSVGMRDDALPCDPKQVPSGAAVLDLVYRAGETRWVRECRARGHAAADGLTMLIEQGARAFERWLGVAPDRDVMRRALAGDGR